ncbi:MAG: ABC transporter ATP-binding protein [bacterium]
MGDYAIETCGLRKTFPGDVVAVNGLGLQVERGSVYGLIGRNGAGKTTTLRLLMGLLRPSSGTARVLGADLLTASADVRANVAYVSQIQQIHSWMTAEELCHYLSYFYGGWDQTYARALADRFRLPWDRQVGLLSGGEQRKVAVLLAFAARPKVLILDEPAAGLDPIARRELVTEIVEVISSGDECTVLFSTHIISDLERVADHVGIMDQGKMVMSARIEDLQSKTKRVQVIFEKEPPPGFAVPGAVHTSTWGPVITAVARIDDKSQLDEVRKIPGVRINLFPLGLEDIFIDLFGRDAQGEFRETRQ